MAETGVRPRTVEYYNPRPLILGVCFFWGVAMGFCLYFFRAPETFVETPAPAPQQTQQTQQASEQELRLQGIPGIAEIEPTPTPPSEQRPRLETMQLSPPPPLLTTDGGLTGRNAAQLTRPQSRLGGGSVVRPPTRSGPPPIPDLVP